MRSRLAQSLFWSWELSQAARAKVITYIREQAGKHFDPCVVEAFLHLEEPHQAAGDGMT